MMRTSLFGNTGLRVSEAALGTMTFGEDWGWGADRATSQAIFDAYVQAGGNFIDTSCNYTNGTSEKFVGEFTRSERDYFVISTKYTLHSHASRQADFNAGGNHRKNLFRTVEGSLRRLQTEYLDILWLHIWDGTTPVDEILRGLDDLVTAGKVHYIGISDSPAWAAAYAVAVSELRGWARFAGYQGEYSLLERGAEREILPMTHSLHMAFMAFSMLAGGALSGKFNQGSPGQESRVRQVSPQALAMAQLTAEIAAEIGQTPSQVAIRWVKQQSANIIPILGVRRLAQLEDNLGMLQFSLSPDHLSRLNAANPLLLTYPESFYQKDWARSLIFGPEAARFVNRSQSQLPR